MSYIFEQRNQEGLCWLARTGNGSDQAHPCYLKPALPHLQREVVESKSCWEAYDFIKPKLTNWFIPGCVRKNYYIDTFFFSLVFVFGGLFVGCFFFFFSLPLPLYSWYRLKKEGGIVLLTKIFCLNRCMCSCCCSLQGDLSSHVFNPFWHCMRALQQAFTHTFQVSALSLLLQPAHKQGIASTAAAHKLILRGKSLPQF